MHQHTTKCRVIVTEWIKRPQRRRCMRRRRRHTRPRTPDEVDKRRRNGNKRRRNGNKRRRNGFTRRRNGFTRRRSRGRRRADRRNATSIGRDGPARSLQRWLGVGKFARQIWCRLKRCWLRVGARHRREDHLCSRRVLAALLSVDHQMEPCARPRDRDVERGEIVEQSPAAFITLKQCEFGNPSANIRTRHWRDELRRLARVGREDTPTRWCLAPRVIE